MRILVLLIFVLAAAAQDASQLFQKQCSVCHGDGRGTERGPNLIDSRRLRARSVDELRGLVRNGVPSRGMPAFDLPPAELNLITLLLRSWNAPASESNPPGNRSAGESYFFGAGGCSKCHMVMGKGAAVGPDLSMLGREQTLPEIEESIRQPAAKIKAGYEVATVRLNGGATVRGFARNRSRYNVQLQDLHGKFHLLDAGEFSQIAIESGSMMPAANCSVEQCKDLLAYLSSLAGTPVGPLGKAFDNEGGPSFQQIANPKADDWPTYHGNISGNRHSTLMRSTQRTFAIFSSSGFSRSTIKPWKSRR